MSEKPHQQSPALPILDSKEFRERYGFNYEDVEEHLPAIEEKIKKLFGKDDRPPFAQSLKDGIMEHSRLSPFNTYVVEQNSRQSLEEFYNFNSHGLRSDEFTRDHRGMHVLFAGCSVTFGDGMPEEYIWPRLVYDRLSEHAELSGYFNIAMCGAHFDEVNNQIFRYFQNFGYPKYLFVNYPAFKRTIDKHDDIRREYENFYYSYKMIEHICQQNGVELIAFTWDSIAYVDAKDSRHDFHNDNNPTYTNIDLDIRPFLGKNFYQYRGSELEEYLYEFETRHPDHPYKNIMMYAFDRQHPGIAEHSFYANIAYNQYRRRL